MCFYRDDIGGILNITMSSKRILRKREPQDWKMFSLMHVRSAWSHSGSMRKFGKDFAIIEILLNLKLKQKETKEIVHQITRALVHLYTQEALFPRFSPNISFMWSKIKYSMEIHQQIEQCRSKTITKCLRASVKGIESPMCRDEPRPLQSDARFLLFLSALAFNSGVSQ